MPTEVLGPTAEFSVEGDADAVVIRITGRLTGRDLEVAKYSQFTVPGRVEEMTLAAITRQCPVKVDASHLLESTLSGIGIIRDLAEIYRDATKGRKLRIRASRPLARDLDLTQVASIVDMERA